MNCRHFFMTRRLLYSLSSRHSFVRMFTVCFEGNIGCGKTTSLQYLANRVKDASVKLEPVNEWRNFRGINFLHLLYSDVTRWGFAFEHYAQLTRLKVYENVQNEKYSAVKLIERSIFSSRFCFTENLYKSGKMSKIEYIIIDEWFKFLTSSNKFHVDLIVYLRTNPQTVYQRIKQRSRCEESELPLAYLEDLHDLHENWLIDGKFLQPAPVLIIDANLDQREMLKSIDKNLEVILGHEKHSNEFSA